MNLKKPKFWNFKNPNFFSYLLYPISLIIILINSLKDRSNKKKFKIKTVCIGNIYLGGTGKTSLSIKLNKILYEKNFKSCFIKKFYKNQIDEQKLLKNNGKLFMASKRIDAIQQAENENYDIAILDDGLQDNSIKYDVSFVCFNNFNWIGNGMIIPSGPLRENIKSLKKYNHVFINGNLENIDQLTKEILKINPNLIIHLGKYEIINLNEFRKDEKYLIFSGIGNHETFVSMFKKAQLNVLKEIEFPDHYNYEKKDIDKIISEASDLNCTIVTTEKDYLRMNDTYLDKIKVIKSELKIIDEDKFIKSII